MATVFPSLLDISDDCIRFVNTTMCIFLLLWQPIHVRNSNPITTLGIPFGDRLATMTFEDTLKFNSNWYFYEQWQQKGIFEVDFVVVVTLSKFIFVFNYCSDLKRSEKDSFCISWICKMFLVKNFPRLVSVIVILSFNG